MSRDRTGSYQATTPATRWLRCCCAIGSATVDESSWSARVAALAVFTRECRGWTFTAVDPSAEMLRQAKVTLEAAGAANRVSWVQGGVENSSQSVIRRCNGLWRCTSYPTTGVG